MLDSLTESTQVHEHQAFLNGIHDHLLRGALDADHQLNQTLFMPTWKLPPSAIVAATQRTVATLVQEAQESCPKGDSGVAGATSLLQLAEGCLSLCPAPALADGQAIVGTLLSGIRASKGLTALRAARLEPDAGKKAKALASAMKELKHPGAAVSPEQMRFLNEAGSRSLQAEASAIAAWEQLLGPWLKERDQAVREYQEARASKAKLAMVACITDLAKISGGGADGQVWDAQVADDDWTTLQEKGSRLIENFPQDAIQQQRTQLTKALKTYQKEAKAAGISDKTIETDTKETQKHLGLSLATFNQVSRVEIMLCDQYFIVLRTDLRKKKKMQKKSRTKNIR